jgi:type II secretory pathway component PulK
MKHLVVQSIEAETNSESIRHPEVAARSAALEGRRPHQVGYNRLGQAILLPISGKTRAWWPIILRGSRAKKARSHLRMTDRVRARFTSDKRRFGSQRGMALVTVLWTMVLLSTAAMAASTMFRGYVGVMAIDKDRARADALLTAGLETAAGLMLRLDDTPPNDVDTTISLSTGDVGIRLNDEGGLIDINKAPVEVLAALFRSIGARNADVIAQNIVAARNKGNGTSGQNAPSAQNAAPAQNGTAANPADDARPFTDVRELASIPGVQPEWISAIAPMTTVFGKEAVNPLTAPADVIGALPGIEEAQVRAFLDLRRRIPDDSKQLLVALGPAQKYAAEGSRLAVGVSIDARVSDGYHAKAKAIIVAVDGDSQPYRVLAWTPISAVEAGDSPAVMAGQ